MSYLYIADPHISNRINQVFTSQWNTATNFLFQGILSSSILLFIISLNNFGINCCITKTITQLELRMNKYLFYWKDFVSLQGNLLSVYCAYLINMVSNGSHLIYLKKGFNLYIKTNNIFHGHHSLYRENICLLTFSILLKCRRTICFL